MLQSSLCIVSVNDSSGSSIQTVTQGLKKSRFYYEHCLNTEDIYYLRCVDGRTGAEDEAVIEFRGCQMNQETKDP